MITVHLAGLILIVSFVMVVSGFGAGLLFRDRYLKGDDFKYKVLRDLSVYPVSVDDNEQEYRAPERTRAMLALCLRTGEVEIATCSCTRKLYPSGELKNDHKFYVITDKGRRFLKSTGT